MPNIRLDRLTRGQLRAMDIAASRRYSRLIWTGAIRQGKGVGASNAMLDTALRNAVLGIGNHQYAVAGATAGSFARNNELYLVDIAEQAGLRMPFRGGTRPHYDLGPGIAKFFLYGGDNKRSYHYVRGLTAHSAWVDESTLCDEQFIVTLEERLTYADSLLILTHNADAPAHWIKRKWIDSAHKPDTPRTALIDTDFRENPHYPEERRRQLEALNPNTANYKRAIGNQWAGPEGLIVPIPPSAYSEQDLPLIGDVIMDPGTASITAALLAVRLPDGKGLILDEYYWRGDEFGRRPDYEHVRAIRDKWRIGRVILDPAGASMRAEWQAQGFFTDLANNAWDEGIQVVNNALYQGELLIHPRCVELTGESNTWRWNDTQTAPIKSANHLIDCLRYYAMDRWPTLRSYFLR